VLTVRTNRVACAIGGFNYVRTCYGLILVKSERTVDHFGWAATTPFSCESLRRYPQVAGPAQSLKVEVVSA
jgi:hypothetical protein